MHWANYVNVLARACNQGMLLNGTTSYDSQLYIICKNLDTYNQHFLSILVKKLEKQITKPYIPPTVSSALLYCSALPQDFLARKTVIESI